MTMELTIFERATRQPLRFQTAAGLLAVEDLWNLPLTSDTGRPNLDDIAKDLHHHLKVVGDEVSFVKPVEKSDDGIKLAFDVVKRIIDVRVAERDDAKATADRNQRKQEIMAAIERKRNENLSSTS